MTNDCTEYRAPVKFDIGAKAEAKFEVTTRIPDDASGRFLDAITDIIRPFSESRGLKADLIKLQRTEIAMQVANNARQKLEASGLPAKPIPMKALVPLLEQASLEDIDAELIECWSNLLASASESYDVEVITFVEILSKIGPREAVGLQKFIRSTDSSFWDSRDVRAMASPACRLYKNEREIKSILHNAIDQNEQAVFERVVKYFPAGYPVLVSRVDKSAHVEGAVKIEKILEWDFVTSNAKAFDILEYHRLIKQGYAGFAFDLDAGEMAVNLRWWELTELGIAFLRRIAFQRSDSRAKARL